MKPIEAFLYLKAKNGLFLWKRNLSASALPAVCRGASERINVMIPADRGFPAAGWRGTSIEIRRIAPAPDHAPCDNFSGRQDSGLKHE
jgi:hypothetical protein